MPEKKGNSFLSLVKDGLSNFSQLLVASIVPQIKKGAESILEDTEKKIKKMEKRILRNILSYLIIFAGLLFLILSLFFFLVEQLYLSKALSFLVISVVLLFTGLLIKLKN